MTLSLQTISYLLGLAAVLTIIFNVYNSFKNPQIKTDQEAIKMSDRMKAVEAQIQEIKETHLASVESNIKELSKSVHDLALNVTRLTTIIDERIPRVNP